MNNTQTLQQKLEQALAYLGNKHLLAKNSKFTYIRGHSVGTVILLAGTLGKAEDFDGPVTAVEDYAEGMW